MEKPTIQFLLKKHFGKYTPTYVGITFDGKNLYPKVKGVSISQVNKFLKEVDSLYEFKINNNVISEPLESDDDLYVYFIRDLSRKGFQLFTD